MDLSELTRYGYAGIFVAYVLEYLALPIPGEELLVFLGFLTARGDFSLPGALIAASGGTITGFFLAFALGRRFGRPILERYGRFVHLTPKRLARAEDLFERYRWPFLLLGRYVVGIRHAVPYLSGISELTWSQFALANVLGTALWVLPLVYAGRSLGQRWDLVVMWADRFGWWALGIGGGLAALAAIAYYARRRRAAQPRA